MHPWDALFFLIYAVFKVLLNSHGINPCETSMLSTIKRWQKARFFSDNNAKPLLQIFLRNLVIRIVFSGGKRTRTADILLAKQALYQLSYTPNNEWAILDLNQGPHPYQGCALTTWANGPGETFVGCDLDKFRNWNQRINYKTNSKIWGTDRP